MQAYNTQHSFTYNAALAAQLEVAADDYLGLFVNCNTATVRYALTNTLGDAQQQFEGLVANKYTHINDSAYPVLVYMNANEFVAWYDWENMCGYIAATQQQAAAHAVAA
jgi:hypothetical protein